MTGLNLKIAFRSLRKNRFFSLINISALSLGITLCLLILMYIVNELSYESFQKNGKRIFRITAEWGAEGNKMKFAGVMPALGPALDSASAQVEASVRLKKAYDATFTTEKKEDIKEADVIYADRDFFKVFSFKLKQGDTEKVLAEPFSIVISEKIASKYFNNTEVIGKTLLYNDKPVRITGLMENPPDNTHLHNDIVISYSTLKAMGSPDEHPWNSWGDCLTYIMLKDGAKSSEVLPLAGSLFKQNAGEWLAGRMKFDFQPLSEIHWNSETRGDIGDKSDKMYIYIFLSAAIFVLIIACFNFLNLSISQYLGRLKEIGIRKTAGALKKQLVGQFITESGVIISVSAIIAITLFEILYLKLYSYLGASYVIHSSHFIFLALILLLIIILVGLLSGIYPAFYISRFSPIEILRNETTGAKGKLTFRKILVVLQFFITIILITGTIVLYRQLSFMKNSDLGFKKENVAMLGIDSGEGNSKKYEVLRTELLKNPAITAVSGAFTVPGVNSMQSFSVRKEASGPETAINMQGVPVDIDYVRTLGLDIVSGRDFSQEFPSDRTESIIINQTAARVLGLTDAVGARLEIPGEENKEREVKVIGVVRDFHIQSFRNKISPLVIYPNSKMFICVIIRTLPDDKNRTAEFIKSAYKSVFPDAVANFRYLSDAYDNLYKNERKSGEVLSVFTILALIISCLGLFGFTSFIVTKRIKEVGIRKVLGARVTSITALLSGQFAGWILISGILAVPVAYFIASRWLGSFAFKVKINWWIFVVAILFELLIALATISFHLVRVALKNPVESLRYE
jgi:putative ABC transport system permease protein